MLRAVVPLAPTSDAALELGLLLQMLGRADASAVLQRVALLASRSPEPMEIARGARAQRALGQLRPGAEASYQRAANLAPNDPSIETGFGQLFLQTEQNGEALKSFQTALKADPRWTPALVGAAAALADDDPPQAAALAKRALEINPSSVEALRLPGESGDGRRQTERGPGTAGEGAGDQPVEPRRPLPAGGDGVRRRQAAGIRGGGGQGAGHRAQLRRGLPGRRRAGGEQLSVPGGGRVDAPRAGAGSGQPPGAHRSRHAPVAHGRRGGGARRPRAFVQASSLQRRRLQPAGDDGQARHVRNDRGRRLHLQDAQGGGRRSSGVHHPAHSQGGRRVLRSDFSSRPRARFSSRSSTSTTTSRCERWACREWSARSAPASGGS